MGDDGGTEGMKYSFGTNHMDPYLRILDDYRNLFFDELEDPGVISTEEVTTNPDVWHRADDIDALPRKKGSEISDDVFVYYDKDTQVNDHYNFTTGEWSLGIGQPTHWRLSPDPPQN